MCLLCEVRGQDDRLTAPDSVFVLRYDWLVSRLALLQITLTMSFVMLYFMTVNLLDCDNIVAQS